MAFTLDQILCIPFTVSIIKGIIPTPTNVCKKTRRYRKKLQSMCWNVKKLKSLNLVKKNSKGEWKEIPEGYRKNKQTRELA